MRCCRLRVHAAMWPCLLPRTALAYATRLLPADALRLTPHPRPARRACPTQIQSSDSRRAIRLRLLSFSHILNAARPRHFPMVSLRANITQYAIQSSNSNEVHAPLISLCIDCAAASLARPTSRPPRARVRCELSSPAHISPSRHMPHRRQLPAARAQLAVPRRCHRAVHVAQPRCRVAVSHCEQEQLISTSTCAVESRAYVLRYAPPSRARVSATGPANAT